MQEAIAMQNKLGPKTGTSGSGIDGTVPKGDTSSLVSVGESLFGSVVTTRTVPAKAGDGSKGKGASSKGVSVSSSTAQIGVNYNELFSKCKVNMIAQTDVELKKLIGIFCIIYSCLCLSSVFACDCIHIRNLCVHVLNVFTYIYVSILYKFVCALLLQGNW